MPSPVLLDSPEGAEIVGHRRLRDVKTANE
jgi:hypothetical protein